MNTNAPQREHDLREVFNGSRWIVHTGSPWRYMPNDLPPWPTVYQHSQRGLSAGIFAQMIGDLRTILRLLQGRSAQPNAVIFDSRTLQSMPESGARVGYDGAKKKKDSKIHMAVDTLRHLLALHVTSANEQDRSQVSELAAAVQETTDRSVQIAFVDQGYTGDDAEDAAYEHDIHLEVVKLPKAKKGFVLLPRRWVVERSLGWLNRFRRLTRDYERLASTLAGMHRVAFACLMLQRMGNLMAESA